MSVRLQTSFMHATYLYLSPVCLAKNNPSGNCVTLMMYCMLHMMILRMTSHWNHMGWNMSPLSIGDGCQMGVELSIYNNSVSLLNFHYYTLLNDVAVWIYGYGGSQQYQPLFFISLLGTHRGCSCGIIAQHILLSYTNCKMPPLVGNNNM